MPLDVERVSFWVAISTSIVGFFLALGKIVHWIATISEEHARFLKHLEETSNDSLRLHDLEIAYARAEEERAELLAEIRGLRKDLLTYLSQGD